MKYEFTIIGRGVDTQSDDFANRLFELGGDDATVAYKGGDTVIVSFHREASNLGIALLTAFAAVERAGAHVTYAVEGLIDDLDDHGIF